MYYTTTLGKQVFFIHKKFCENGLNSPCSDESHSSFYHQIEATAQQKIREAALQSVDVVYYIAMFWTDPSKRFMLIIA